LETWQQVLLHLWECERDIHIHGSKQTLQLDIGIEAVFYGRENRDVARHCYVAIRHRADIVNWK